MEKKFEFTLLLTESQIDVLLDSLSMDECAARQLCDKHLDEISDFGEFLKRKGIDPETNSVYTYHKEEAEHFHWKAEILGSIFDEISDSLSNRTTVYSVGDDVIKNV